MNANTTSDRIIVWRTTASRNARHSKTDAAKSWTLASFVALAYAVSWVWAFPFVAAVDVIEKGVGWPTYCPRLLGPALAAFVVTPAVWGRAGARDLLARMARWRMPLRWWARDLELARFLRRCARSCCSYWQAAQRKWLRPLQRLPRDRCRSRGRGRDPDDFR